MQKLSNQTKRMLLKTEEELSNQLVGAEHPFRELNHIIDFDLLVEPLRKECYSDIGQNGLDIKKGLKALLVQFWEDYSDRQMEKCLVVNKYTDDKDAKWGAKSKNNIWFGFKRHCAVDMRHGLIRNAIATPANVLDFRAVGEICPNQGMVFMDKLYDCEYSNQIIKDRGVTTGR